MKFTIFQDSLVGDRSGNEDRVGYAYGKDVLLMVICDGMGGHHGGEIAAEIAVQEITRRFKIEARNKVKRPQTAFELQKRLTETYPAAADDDRGNSIFNTISKPLSKLFSRKAENES